MIFEKFIARILSSDINKRIFSHSFWILLGNVISKFVLVISTIYMTRFMDMDVYGQFGIIKTTIYMFALFAGLELGMTVTKYIAEFRTRDKERMEKIAGLSNLFSIAFSIVIGLVIFLFSKEIANQINAPELQNEIKIISVGILFSSLNGIQSGILSGLERFKELSIITTIASVISSILLVITAKYFSLTWVVWAFISNYIILFTLNFLYLRKIFYNKYDVRLFKKENLEELKVLGTFSIPASLTILVYSVVVWYCSVLLISGIGGKSEMAIFDIANQWRNAILFIPATISQIALPLLTSVNDDDYNYWIVLKKNLYLTGGIGTLMTIIMIIGSPIIVGFYVSSYQDLLIPLILMLVTGGLVSISSVMGKALASKDKMWLRFYITLLWGTILIVVAYILIVQYEMGAIGLAIAYVISTFIDTIIQYIVIRRFSV